MQLGLHVGPLTAGAGAVSDSAAYLWTLSPNQTALSRLSRRCSLSYCNLICQGLLISMGGLPFSEEKRRGDQRNGEGRGKEQEESSEGKLQSDVK